MDDAGWIPLKEAAAQLGLHPVTLRKQAQAGRLQARKVGRDWLTRSEWLEDYRRVSLGQVGPKPRQAEKE